MSEKHNGFGIACAVTWTELYNAMVADGLSPANKCGLHTRKWIEKVVTEYFDAHLAASKAQTVDVEAIREVIKDLRGNRRSTFTGWADKLSAALPKDQ